MSARYGAVPTRHAERMAGIPALFAGPPPRVWPADDAVLVQAVQGPLAGAVHQPLKHDQQDEVRQATTEHVSSIAEHYGGDVFAPAEVRIVVRQKD